MQGHTHSRRKNTRQPKNKEASIREQSNRYADNCAVTVNQVIDRILHNQDGNDRDRQDSAIQDASSWSEEDRRDFIQYKKNKEDTQADRVRQVNFKTVANNLQDSFQVLGSTKATFYRETEDNNSGNPTHTGQTNQTNREDFNKKHGRHGQAPGGNQTQPRNSHVQRRKK